MDFKSQFLKVRIISSGSLCDKAAKRDIVYHDQIANIVLDKIYSELNNL